MMVAMRDVESQKTPSYRMLSRLEASPAVPIAAAKAEEITLGNLNNDLSLPPTNPVSLCQNSHKSMVSILTSLERVYYDCK